MKLTNIITSLAGVAGFYLAAGSANAAITIVNTQFAAPGTGPKSYDATGLDKVVVVFAAESGFNNNNVLTMNVTFNGVNMTLGRFQQSFPATGTNDNGAVSIWYMDNPFQGVADFTVSATTTGGGINGAFFSIIGLTGTADGIGAVNGTSHTTGPGSFGTSLTTTGANSLVIAGIQNSGNNNVTGAFPTAVSPLTLVHSGSGGNTSGSNWSHGASGRQSVATSGTLVTPTFTTGSGAFIDVAAVEFLEAAVVVIPEPSAAALLGIAGLALIMRRRK